MTQTERQGQLKLNMKAIDYKLCILAAGSGTRNTTYQHLHKALLPLGNKAVISHIIDLVPSHVPVVIAVGYKKEQVMAYVNYTHPDKEIEFVDIENFDGPGSGPGLSLFECREHLECPFIFLGADTLIDPREHNFVPDSNWVGVGSCSDWCDNTDTYCLYDVERGFYYGENKGGWQEWNNCFIGIAGILDYKNFWKSLENPDLIKGEHQVLNGFKQLQDVSSLQFKSWRDTGNNMSYAYCRREYKDIVEPKPDEVIYIDNGKVLKYFNDENKVTDRVARSLILQPNVPDTYRLEPHIFGYDYIPGMRLSDICNNELFDKFFDFVKHMYLKDGIKESTHYDEERFNANCTKMYHDKTYARVAAHQELESLDKVKSINGHPVLPVKTLLDMVDWNEVNTKAVPAFLHGDMSPENIIYDTENNKFVLIDWRDRFGDDLYIGDVYYDLSKLDHAFLVNGEVIRGQRYKVNVNEESAEIEIHLRSNLLDARQHLEAFCINNNLDFGHVKLLTAITLLNIASAHSDKMFNRFLFLYGKTLLMENLNDTGKLNSTV